MDRHLSVEPRAPEGPPALEEAKRRLLELHDGQLELEIRVRALRRRLDEARRRARTYRTALASLSREWIAVLDEDLRIVAGGGDVTLAGLDLSKRVGFGLAGLVDGERLRMLEACARRALDGETLRIEMRIRGADVELRFRPVPLAAGRARMALVAAHDVGEHRRRERSLDESRQFLQDVVDVSGEGCLEVDVPSGTARVCRSWNLLTGRPEHLDTMSLAEWAERVHPQDRPGVEPRRRALLDGSADSLDVTCRMRRDDGTYRWLRIRARVVGWDGEG